MDKKNNSGDRNSGHWNSGNWNSGNWNSGDMNSGDRNSGNWNSGYRNSGHWNSGDMNSGDRNSGWFNTDEPLARFFNRSTDIKLSEFYNSERCPSWAGFNLTKWIDADKMSEEEKKSNPHWETAGGYLRTYKYKEAWANFWRVMAEENRQKFLNLPNFDAGIFKEITGIDESGGNTRMMVTLSNGKQVSEETIIEALKAITE